MLALMSVLRLRAVRTFMQPRVADTPHSGEAAVAAPRETLSEKNTDVARACRITTSLLGHRSPQQALQSPESDVRSPAGRASENAAMVNRIQQASVLADASGKAAYLTHAAHQHRFDELCTADLVKTVNRTWASWTRKKKLKWVTATPQGWRALRLLADDDCSGISRKGRVAIKWGLASAHRGPPHIGKDEAWSSLVPRDLSAAAVLCKPAKRRQPTLREWGGSLPTPSAASPLTQARKQGVFDVAAATSHSCEVPHHLSVSRLQQRNRWKQELNRMFGGNDSRTFQGSIKELQQEYEGIESSAQPAPEVSKASSMDILLNFCDDMNIGSPRKVFVLQKMIPFLDSNERDVDNSSAAPLSLAEVKVAAQRFSQEFDQHRRDILKTCGNSLAVQAYEKTLIDEELTQVRWKLNRFQSKVPLLRRITNLCMGL